MIFGTVFSGKLKLLLIPKVGPSHNNWKLFLQLSELDDELLSMAKIITSLVVLLLKLHSPALL